MDDKLKAEKVEVIQRSLLGDSKNRKRYLLIRQEKGLENTLFSKNRKLFNEIEEKPEEIISELGGETMNENINTNNEKLVKEKSSVKKAPLTDKEKEKLQAQKAKEKEKAKLQAQKAKEKERAKIKLQKEKEKEKAKILAQKAKEKEKAKLLAQKEKEKEKAKLQAQKEKEKQKAASKDVKNTPTANKNQEKNKNTSENLDKLRHKVEAQKLLDQGFIQESAEKAQTKEAALREKLDIAERNFTEIVTSNIESEIDELSELNNKLKEENEKLILENSELKETIKKLNEEIILVDDLKKEINSLNDINDEIIKEKDELKISNQKLNKELHGLNSYIEDLKTENSDLEASLKEKEELANNFKASDEEVATLKEEKNKLEAKVLELENSLKEKEELTNNFKVSDEEVVTLKEEKNNLEAKVLELENSLKEKEELANNFKELDEEVVTLKEEKNKLEAKVLELENSLKEKEELDNEVTTLKEENTKLENLLNEKQSQITSFEEQIVLKESTDEQNKELLEKVSKLEAEINELKIIVNKMSLENASLLNSTSVPKEVEEYINKLKTEKDEALAKANELSIALKEKEASLINEVVDDVEEEYNITEEIKKIKEEISIIKKREVSNLENSEKYVYTPNPNQEIMQRIRYLEQEIYQKDQQILQMSERFNNVNEQNIANPEFKSKIRRIRDMKRELNASFEDEKAFISKSINQTEHLIKQKRVEVDAAKVKLENIEKEYSGKTDRTSLGREAYLSKKGKAVIELELFEDKLRRLTEEDLKALQDRYNYLVDSYNERIEQLNQSEAELVNYYLNEVKNNLINGDEDYINKIEEKDYLVRQLSELNVQQQQTQSTLLKNNEALSRAIETNQEIKAQLLIEKRENLERQIDRLNSEYQQKNMEYTEASSKLSVIKVKYDERVEAEEGIRNSDEVVKEYLRVKDDIESFSNEYRLNLDGIRELEEKLDSLDNDSSDKTELLHIKAKLSDLDIINSDLLAKIDFYKKKINALATDERVVYYLNLVESINELEEKNNEISMQAERLKKELEQIQDHLVKASKGLENL